MMLRYSFALANEADLVDNAVKKVLKEGFRTCDIMQDGATLVGTSQMGDKIIEALDSYL
jgi:3-isopropylmalate dehydrogenase